MPLRDKDQLPELLRSLRADGDGLPRPEADYFSRLAETAIREGKRPERRPPPIPRYWLGAAATVLLLLLAGWLLLDGRTSEPPPPRSVDALLADVDADLIEEYISEHIEEYDTELLIGVETRN